MSKQFNRLDILDSGDLLSAGNYWGVQTPNYSVILGKPSSDAWRDNEDAYLVFAYLNRLHAQATPEQRKRALNAID